MVRVRVEYDKYNRAFKLLDQEFGSVLENGAQYELIVPLILEAMEAEEGDLAFMSATPLAHA